METSPSDIGPSWLQTSGWRLSAFIGLILLTAGGWAAESDTSTLALQKLKSMSVEELLAQQVESVSRKPEVWSEAASNVFLIPGRAAQDIGATTLPDLLRLAPNLFVAQSTSAQWGVDARGFVRSNGFSNKLLVMIDGRTVYSPLFSNVFWDSTAVFLPDLERIEVISGPAGATWGANAVNGVINIQSKSAHETLGGLVYGGSGTDVDSFGVRYGAKIGSTGAMRAYVQGSNHAATQSAAGTEDGFDSWKTLQGGFRADWGDPTVGELTVQGDAFRGRYDNGTLPQTRSDGANLLARWSRTTSPDSSFWIRAYHDYSMRDSQGALTEITRTSDVEFQHSAKIGDFQQLLWGANYRLMSDSMKTVGFAIVPPKLDFVLGSIFAQHQVVFAGNALRLTTGLRLEHNYFSGWEYQPSLRLAWHEPGQTVWIAASRATRIPSRLETGYFAPENPPYLVVGGQDVVAETVDAYELGWRSQPAKNLSVTSTFYFNDYDHLRSVEPTTPVTFANGVAGRSYGLEMFVDWEVTPWWRLRAGGFSMNQQTWLKPGGADLEHAGGESSFPDYQIQLRNFFRIGNSVTLWSALRRVAEVQANDSGGGVVPAYTELDLNLGWKIRPDLEFSLTGRNLLHRSHPEIGGLAVRREIGRTVQTMVRLAF